MKAEGEGSDIIAVTVRSVYSISVRNRAKCKVNPKAMSLAQLLKTHTQKQANTKRQNEQLRKDAAIAVNQLTDSLTETLNERISEVFTRQKEIEIEARKLSAQTTRYAKQTKQWLNMIEGFNAALKVRGEPPWRRGIWRGSATCMEIGDVQNWATIVETDMREVMATLEFVHRGFAHIMDALFSISQTSAQGTIDGEEPGATENQTSATVTEPLT
ncbi:GCN5-like protein 1-domain-containing protein [Endogone sp. FLAS-F59071]|nr:GCN5-like protein 1-domain-containing protein [Endogone sp. FLAS-F59071]|eukprot:RUS22142.1 GCN5-like protein 1-domain-containing protein [Endogone sp. FLAS-F59071]